MRRACVTGGAGFVGGHLAERLLASGTEVVLVDDLTSGDRDLAEALVAEGATFLEGDVLTPDLLEQAFEGCDWVFHLQANADVRRGLERPTRDLEQNTLATSRVLEAMRAAGADRIAFASTGSVYGEPDVFPTPEDAPFPQQTSLYGASKLACEGLISAYAHGFGFTAVALRYVSVLGERYTHGHLLDFYLALTGDPSRLLVQGDGSQRKSYIYAGDCVAATLVAAAAHHESTGMFVYNVGTPETQTVDESIDLVTRRLGVTPRVEYTGGSRGWIGDSPVIQLDTSRLSRLGWRPQLTIKAAAERTLDWFEESGVDARGAREPLPSGSGGAGER